MKAVTTLDNQLADFCSWRAVLLVAVIMVLLAIVMLLVSGQRASGGWEILGMTAMFLQWLGLLSLAALCLASPWLRRMSLLLNAVLTFALIQLVTLAVSEVVYQLISVYPLLEHLKPDNHRLFLLRNSAISIIISGVALRYMYVQRQLQLQIQAENEARIQALQARIRPHFLFNSMNTIAALTHIDAYAAEKAIIDLSEIFRASLQSEETMTSLDEEIALTRHYVEVESLRLQDRLSLDWQIDGALSNVSLPRLTIQPLVENAIYHGIEPRPDGGEISIVARKTDQAIIEISNPLPSTEDDKLRQGNNIALQNIRDRLKIAYGQRAKLISEQSSESYKVTLELPLSKDRT